MSLCIFKLKEQYSRFKIKRSENKTPINKEYLEMSIFKNRDIFEFDPNNFNLIKKIKFLKKEKKALKIYTRPK